MSYRLGGQQAATAPPGYRAGVTATLLRLRGEAGRCERAAACRHVVISLSLSLSLSRHSQTQNKDSPSNQPETWRLEMFEISIPGSSNSQQTLQDIFCTSWSGSLVTDVCCSQVNNCWDEILLTDKDNYHQHHCHYQGIRVISSIITLPSQPASQPTSGISFQDCRITASLSNK